MKAFPEGGAITHRDGTLQEVRFEGGMTLRDYFAAKAMQGIIANQLCTHTVTFEEVAGRAYATADAMLKERER